MGNSNPTMPARQLARELKRLREARRLTQAKVSDYVGCPSTTISKIETAERNVPAPHLKLMLQLYRVDSTHAKTLMQLADQAKERGWWSDYTVPKWFVEYIGLETAASGVWTYESEYVPGLLQTQSYTEAINSVGLSDNAEGSAAVRAARQRRLTGDAPLVLRTVLNEAVLRRPVGSTTVMREQLAALREAAARPNITLQILPFSAGAHPGMTGPFTLLRFSEEAMDVVFIELRGDAVYQEQPSDVKRHAAVFERLSDLALSADDTVSLLTEMEGQL